MKKTKLLAVALSGIMLAGMAVGCNDSKTSSTKGTGKEVELKVMSHWGGIGNQWLYNAIDRFEEAYKDKQYGTKTGVIFDEPLESSSVPTNLATEGMHIYFTEQKDRAVTYAQSGTWMDLTDVIKAKNETRDGQAISIEDKLDDSIKSSIMIGDKYYALPHYEYYGGMTYDVDLFDGIRSGQPDQEQKLYLAKESASDTTDHTSAKYGVTIRLVNDLEDKSCGPDGEYGTTDDGLPGSWAEFLALMEYMKEELNMSPVQLSGEFLNYSDLFMIGAWAQLAGDRMSTYFSLDGEIEVVTGELNEPLFPGITYIKKPKTEKVTVKELENREAVFNMVERYYAQAINTIIEREDYFTDDARTGTVNHYTAQLRYLHSGFDDNTVSPFLMEGSFWHNESKINGNFDLLSNTYFYVDPENGRHLSWMALPVTMYGTIEEGDEKAHTMTVIDQAGSWCFANAGFEDDPEISAAIKDFIAFLYSDAELSHFSAETGLAKPMTYPLLNEDKEKLPVFYKNLWDLREKGKVVYNSGTTEAYKSISSRLMFTFSYGNFTPNNKTFLNMLREDKSIKLWDIFKDTLQSYK